LKGEIESSKASSSRSNAYLNQEWRSDHPDKAEFILIAPFHFSYELKRYLETLLIE
jgi:hypothetical protein